MIWKGVKQAHCVLGSGAGSAADGMSGNRLHQRRQEISSSSTSHHLTSPPAVLSCWCWDWVWVLSWDLKLFLTNRAVSVRLCPTATAPLNPLDSKGNYSATSNNTKLVHWPLMGGLLHLIQRGGDWAGCGPAQSPPRCTKCNSPPIIIIPRLNSTMYCYKMVRCSAVWMWRLRG